ncbi:azobenzene reductase [Schleiferia thermophila]|uniref:Azobenzene reductase n=2 Tax=Schleiferia thermophila TaxID=884107 RepID=A0A368ZYP7_9FLAO|nr:azobenzene reductase [Schleiferia thermophila]
MPYLSKHKAMNITILSGATRGYSNSVYVATRIKDILTSIDRNLDVLLINNREVQLPVYEDNDFLDSRELEAIQKVSSQLKSADALVIVSPEYNGGMAGALKNTLDYFRKEYEWKPMGLVSVTSGTLGGQNAMNQMAAFASYVGACLCPTRLLVSQVDSVVKAPASPEALRFETNAKKFCNDLLYFTEVVKTGMLNLKNKEFLKQI